MILKILRNQFFWLSLVLILAFVLRFYRIDFPIADWHSWRQVDTAAVTRNFIKEGFNPFLPKFDDMSAISENPVANPARFRFVEFPIYNIFVYPLYLIFGINEMYHRLVSVIFSVGSTVFLYFIVKKYFDTLTAFFASLTYAILPFNVFFSRTTLPEPTFVFFALGMIYFVDRWIWEGRESSGLSSKSPVDSSSKIISGVLGFLFTAVAFLIKPWAIFFYLPIVYSAFRAGAVKKFLLFSFLAILPFLFWRLWILQQPEGIPASSWLMNGDGIRFRPAFWWWIVQQRIGGQILGVTGFMLFMLGLILAPKKGNSFFHFFAASIFLYFIIFATGNVRHDYYQYIFVPVASVFVASGLVSLLRGESIFIPRVFTISIGLSLYILAIYFGYKHAIGLYQINNYVIVEAGKRADQILPKEAVVVAPYNGDTAFLYQINRPGWPVTALPLTELVADFGVTHFVSVARDDKTNWVLRHFEILEDNPKFVIADLTKIKVSLDGDPEP